MSQLAIVEYPDPRLKRVARPVTVFDERLQPARPACDAVGLRDSRAVSVNVSLVWTVGSQKAPNSAYVGGRMPGL